MPRIRSAFGHGLASPPALSDIKRRGLHYLKLARDSIYTKHVEAPSPPEMVSFDPVLLKLPIYSPALL